MDLPSNTTQPCSCDKFPPTWFPSDEYCASSCPYSLCPECRELQAVDNETITVLDGLSKRRSDIKNGINRRHDRFTSKLPLELISHIFTFAAAEERPPYEYTGFNPRNDKLLDPAVRLGAVCKQWREITLGIPQLWTKLIITEYNLEQAFYPNVIDQRLRRSHTLPLSLEFDVYCLPNEFLDLPYSTVVPLLRSQARRWNCLTFRTAIPGTILNMLLTGLEEKLTLDSFTLQMAEAPEDEVGKLSDISMKYPISPKRLVMEFVPLPQIPIQCNSLTHLTTDHLTIDDLVHVCRQAHNLRYCLLLDDVHPDAGRHSLPDSPVANISMKQLETNARWGAEPALSLLFRHLTLPSLKTFCYGVKTVDNEWAQEEIELLRNFLDRSQPPLPNFSFYFDIHEGFDGDWYRVLPSIAFLEVRVRESFVGRNGERTQVIVERLGAHVEPLALPCLREMKIHTPEMNTHSWKALVAIFPDYENNEDTVPVVRRPLNAVRIYAEMSPDYDPQTMTKATYSRLLAIQKSGVTLQVLSSMNKGLTSLDSDPMRQLRCHVF